MATPLAWNAINYLQRRFPDATVSFGEGRLTVALRDAPLLPKEFRASHMIAQAHRSGVKQRAVAIEDLGIDDLQILGFAQNIIDWLDDLDKDIVIGASDPRAPATSMSSTEMPFAGRLLIYTDRVHGSPDDIIQTFTEHLIAVEIVDQSKLYESAFISYGGQDEAAAQLIDAHLRAKGVETWFFKRDQLPGQKLHRMMHENVNKCDRIILLCSKTSLSRPGVLNEIERAFEREAREGGSSILIPVALDDHVFSDWAPERADLAQQVRDRVIFRLDDPIGSPNTANEQLERLVKALRRW